MIEINNLSKSYGKHLLFKNQTIRMKNGTIYALVGVNGIGKSTLLNSITQSVTIEKGSVQIDNIKSSNFEAKYHFSYIPDSKEMFLNLTGMEFLTMIGKLYKRSKTEVQYDLEYYVRKFRLERSLNNTISIYSLGMRQKIYLIGALLSNANNIILDEPFNGLDPESAAVLKSTLFNYRDKGKLILFSIHNLDLVANFCDKIIFIDNRHEIFEYENPKNFKEVENIFFKRCVIHK